MARYMTRDAPFPERIQDYERARERQYHSRGGYDSQLEKYSPGYRENSTISIAPGYTGAYGNPHSSSGALIRGGGPVIDEPVVEHEHHHVHHHIDHGNVNVTAQVAVRPRAVQREYSYDDLYDRERRYGSGASLGSLNHGHSHGHGHRHGHRHTGSRGSASSGRFARSDIDLNLDASFRSRRGSVYDDRESEYAIIDVPAGTRRVTVDMARDGLGMRESEVNWRRDNGVRRSRGLGNELWTEITKDLVTREAIEDCGYQYEETEFFYYIFEYLHRDQITELTDMTSDIRRRKSTPRNRTPVFIFHRPNADSTATTERVRDIEYESIAGRDRERRTLDWDREDSRTEIVIESGRSNAGGRRRNRYYY